MQPRGSGLAAGGTTGPELVPGCLREQPLRCPRPPGEAVDQQKALVKRCMVPEQRQGRIRARGCVPGGRSVP